MVIQPLFSVHPDFAPVIRGVRPGNVPDPEKIETQPTSHTDISVNSASNYVCLRRPAPVLSGDGLEGQPQPVI
jgi:hypothetical protein